MRRGAARENQGDLTANEMCRHLRQPVILTVGPAIIDLDVLALDIVGFAQRLAERGNLERGIFCRPAAEKPDHLHPTLLRARHERPSRRPPE